MPIILNELILGQSNSFPIFILLKTPLFLLGIYANLCTIIIALSLLLSIFYCFFDYCLFQSIFMIFLQHLRIPLIIISFIIGSSCATKKIKSPEDITKAVLYDKKLNGDSDQPECPNTGLGLNKLLTKKNYLLNWAGIFNKFLNRPPSDHFLLDLHT